MINLLTKVVCHIFKSVKFIQFTDDDGVKIKDACWADKLKITLLYIFAVA